jgi:Rho GTPase-activating protein 1
LKKGPPINPIIVDTEDPHPSLSDWHDYEPNLEFDDTELTATDADKVASACFDDDSLISGEFITTPDDIKTALDAENYEEQLKVPEVRENNRFFHLLLGL